MSANSLSSESTVMSPLSSMLGKHPEEVPANAIYKTEAGHEFNLDHSTSLSYFWSTVLIMEKLVKKN